MTDDLPVLHLPAGLPGFPAANRFVVEPWGDDGPFALLRCLDIDALEFLVAVAASVFPDYEPELDGAQAAALGLVTAEDALVLVLVTVPERAADATANLLAPLVVNIRTNVAAQVVLEDAALEDLRRPLWATAVPAGV